MVSWPSMLTPRSITADEGLTRAESSGSSVVVSLATLNASIVSYRQRKPVEKGTEKVRMFVGGEAAPVTWNYAEVCCACSAWKISGVNIYRVTRTCRYILTTQSCASDTWRPHGDAITNWTVIHTPTLLDIRSFDSLATYKFRLKSHSFSSA